MSTVDRTAQAPGSALAVEQNGINVIPDAERRGKPSDLFWPWCAANIAVLGISYAAFILYFGVSFWQGLVAAAIGTTFSFLLVGFVSLAGRRGSAPTMVLSRAPFGVRGNAVPAAFSYLLLVGWETALASLGVLATSTVFDRLGWGSGDGTKVLAFAVVAVLVIGAGVLGFDAIMKLQKWITLATLVLTVGYIALTADEVDWSAISSIPTGTSQAFIGAIIFAMTGFGLGWVNSGADYSRYLPRSASGPGIVAWTTVGATLPSLLLVLWGLLLSGSDPEVLDAIGADPIGALTTLLPTWYLLPFIVVVLLGLVGGAVLDIYSSGLALLTLGLRLPRWVAAAIDGVIMVIGTIYIVWFADDFIGPFQGFLYTLGVPIAAWAGIFLADVALRRRDYADAELYSTRGRYGTAHPVALGLMALGIFLGWGLVTNFTTDALSWQGYLMDPFGLGKGSADAPSDWTYANVGILVALAVGFLGYLVLGRSVVRKQEDADPF